MSSTSRILVVEDEAPIRMGICDVLAFHGLQPVGVGDGREGLREALSGSYDLLILDVMLPEVDGLTICRQARQRHPEQAILILTARGAEEHILEGFDCGADDYVTKPFSVSQLVARVRALLRRVRAQPTQRFQLGELAVDGDNLRVEARGRQAALSLRDVELLAYFASHAGRALSRKLLLQEVWGFQRVEGVETRCVDMHIAKLRKKLARVTPLPVIETVRGIGYRYGPGDDG